jgi:hypothetical protein
MKLMGGRYGRMADQILAKPSAIMGWLLQKSSHDRHFIAISTWAQARLLSRLALNAAVVDISLTKVVGQGETEVVRKEIGGIAEAWPMGSQSAMHGMSARP